MTTNKEVVLITGGNTGLGLEVVKALAASSTPYEVIVGCRTISKGEAAISSVQESIPQSVSSFGVFQVDLCSDSSLEAAVNSVTSKYGHLDILVNNGGGSFAGDEASGKMSMREAWNASWDTNVTGTQVLTYLAVPLLLKSSNPRLVFVTSGTSTLTETVRTDHPNLERMNTSPPAGWPKPSSLIPPNTAYRSTKCGLNMVMREWTRILRHDRVKVWGISPGFLATGLAGVGAEKLRQLGALDPKEGANFIRDVIRGARDRDTGKVIRANMIQPW
ncbi:hypothetical protein BJ170DRAFT_700892 [Xylariales sp. AK1849]|nr:hypothetical protein BJ170DRAFT_700892 [Xylariales sp. AK1849]